MKISEQIVMLQRQSEQYGDVDVEDVPELILDAKILTFKELKDLLKSNESYGQIDVDIFLKDVRYFLNYTKENNNDK